MASKTLSEIRKAYYESLAALSKKYEKDPKYKALQKKIKKAYDKSMAAHRRESELRDELDRKYPLPVRPRAIDSPQR